MSQASRLTDQPSDKWETEGCPLAGAEHVVVVKAQGAVLDSVDTGTNLCPDSAHRNPKTPNEAPSLAPDLGAGDPPAPPTGSTFGGAGTLFHGGRPCARRLELNEKDDEEAPKQGEATDDDAWVEDTEVGEPPPPLNHPPSWDLGASAPSEDLGTPPYADEAKEEEEDAAAEEEEEEDAAAAAAADADEAEEDEEQEVEEEAEDAAEDDDDEDAEAAEAAVHTDAATDLQQREAVEEDEDKEDAEDAAAEEDVAPDEAEETHEVEVEVEADDGAEDDDEEDAEAEEAAVNDDAATDLPPGSDPRLSGY